jgi:hypothetical protein
MTLAEVQELTLGQLKTLNNNLLEINSREMGGKSVKKTDTSSSNMSENFTLLREDNRNPSSETIYNKNERSQKISVLANSIKERRKKGKKIDLALLGQMFN